jgi:hypothetical protein
MIIWRATIILLYLSPQKTSQIKTQKMKKLLLSFVLVAISATLFAQLLTPKQMDSKLLESRKYVETQSVKAPFDTVGWTLGYLPCFGDPTPAFHIYGLVDASDNDLGYWFGVNYDPSDTSSIDYWAMGYFVDQPVSITGVIIGIAGKTILTGGASSKIELSIYDIADDNTVIAASTYAPGPDTYTGTALATVELAASAIDTAWANLGFNYVPLSAPLWVNEDFSIVSNFEGMRLATDTAYMYCDEPGNHNGMNYSFYNQDPFAYYWVSLSYGSSGALDVNLPLFAVVDMGSAGINDNFFQGMKLTTSPNPASDMLVMEYALQFDSKVKVQIIGSNGAVVKEVELGEQNASNYYKESIDISDLASGNYFVSLMSNGNRLTKQIVVE